MSGFSVEYLGTLDYGQALERQKNEHQNVVQGKIPKLLLLEHPPVITLGRKAHAGDHILASPEYLSRMGITTHQVERGGDVTFHGPGQLVGYPIFPVGRKVRDFLRQLERVIVQTLADYHLEAHGHEGYAGVYVGEKKIASIGVTIKNNVSYHGFALNINTDLTFFDHIIPCGLNDVQMTSLEELTGQKHDLWEVANRVAHHFKAEFLHYDWTHPSISNSDSI